MAASFLCWQLATDNWQLVFQRHTGVLEETPSSEAALEARIAHGKKDAGIISGDAVF